MGYKEEQEAFVSGLTGTSLSETAVLILGLSSLSAIGRYVLHPTAYSFGSLVTEFVGRILPILALCTILSDYAYPLSCIFIFLCLVLLVSKLSWRNNDHLKLERDDLTSYRSDMMISTIVAILAVDFVMFPRRYAKTEVYGYSLMDAGVGSFVFSSGLVSKTRSAGRSLLKSVLPLVVLALARFVAVSAADYQKHVSEYGVHWNFFATLAIVATVHTLIRKPLLLSAFCYIALIVYQIALSYFGLAEYVFYYAERSNWFHANREGILSVIGYLAIAALASDIRSRAKSVLSLWAVALTSLLLCLASHEWIEPASRRSCNLTYVLFIAFVNSASLALMAGCKSPATPLQRALNQGSLYWFLGANLLTGAVNKSMYTIYASDAVATAVMIAYLAVVCVAAWSWNQHGHGSRHTHTHHGATATSEKRQ